MRKLFVFFIFVLMAALVLASCNLPRPNQALTPTGDVISTAAAQTVDALSTLLAPQGTPPPSDITSAPTILPVSSVTPTFTPQASATIAGAPTALPCNRAEFVKDLTVPDGTTFAPGASFVKTWRLKNNGSCTWTNSYRVVFDSGVSMGAPASFNLPDTVAPGDTIDISVNMVAPGTADDYESYWKLQDASGTSFGLGSNGQDSFWVKITVGSTSVPFAVNKVSVSVDNANVTANCPYTFHLTAAITTTAKGEVSYYWQRSDGTKSDSKSITFDSATTRSVGYDMEVDSNFSGWVKVYIDNPNHQLFPEYDLNLTCN